MKQAYDPNYIERFYRFHDDRGRYQTCSLTGAGTTRDGPSGLAWRGIDPKDTGRHWAVPTTLPDWFVRPQEWEDLSPQERLDQLDAAGLIFWPSKKGGMPRYKRYLDLTEGQPLQNIINDIGPISSHAQERLGYPTQKPVALLDRIIKASSNEGDVVFDPFCGCGTTIYAAHQNNRKWIGCDIAILSVQLVRDVLAKRYGMRDGIHYEIKGIPLSLEGAQDLFNRDPHQFQHWAVELAGGFCSQKRSGDKGIDGRIYFEMDKKLPSMVISVKGGHIKPADVRELHGVLARDTNSILAGFICLEKPTKGMIQESASAGIFEYRGKSYDRIQIRSITDLLAGRGFNTPSQVQTMDRSRQAELPV